MRWLDVALIALLVLSVLPIATLEGPVEAMAPQAEEVEPVEDQAEVSEFEEMEQILREEEDMIQGGIAYDAGRRRDPFVSLLKPRIGVERRPTGLDCPIGCLIDEITLTGIFVMPEGPVAQILSPDQEKSYLIRVGDEFHDGDVVAISADGVRFRQMVNDFQEMKPFREVFKELNP